MTDEQMTGWSLIYDRFEAEREGLREALCTLGNGYFASRGAAQEAVADAIHYPGTYLAGAYNRLNTHIAERTVENEDMVNFPNWMLLGFRPEDGDWFNPVAVELISYRQELDLRHGLLCRTVRYRDRKGRETTIASRRLVHMDLPHYAAIETEITPHNWSGGAHIRSGLDGRVVNAGVERYRQLASSHIEPLDWGRVGDTAIHLLVQTNQSHIRVAEAARTDLFAGGQRLECSRRLEREHGLVADVLNLDLREQTPLRIEKIVALYSSRDRAISDCDLAACEAVADAPGFAELLDSHGAAWARLWRRADMTPTLKNRSKAQVDASMRVSLTLRFHIFHLLQTISPHNEDLDAGVPARGLHGEAYRGHIFWDEVFIFPYFLYRFPGLARSLLRYRQRRLPAARRAAREAGLGGALFPWQSGSTGREESQTYHLNPRSGRWLPDHSHLQRHVNAAVVYNIWQYYHVTGDLDFLSQFGAEVIIEIARLWSSLATYRPGLDRFEILGVVGPDEFHDGYPDRDEPGVDNNAYTNVMAAWCLDCALKVLRLLPPDRRDELHEELALGKDELARWDDISRKMRVIFHRDGVISQFEGYEELEEFDWDGYRAKYGDIQRLDRLLDAESDSPNRYKVSKQADVLMLFYLFSAEQLIEIFDRLGYSLDPASIPVTIDYYLKRTSHGSTLSRIIHSWVMARMSRPDTWPLFLEALDSDVADIQGGTTPEGIHLGAMAATVDLMQRCYTGAEVHEDHLRLNPGLPAALRRLKMSLRYRGNWLHIDLGAHRIRLLAGQDGRDAIDIGLGDTLYHLAPGEHLDVSL